MNKLLFSALATLAVVVIVGAQTNYCDRKETDITVWDQCNANALGKRKSVSKCYFHTPSNSYIHRYDFFTCTRQFYGSTAYYLIMPGNCSGTLSPVTDDLGKLDVFNRYDAATGACTLTPPPPPTTTTASTASTTTVSTTTGSDTTTTATTTTTVAGETTPTTATTPTTPTTTTATTTTTTTTLAPVAG